MFDTATLAPPPASDTEADLSDPSAMRAERRLADLETLRRISMEIAQVLGQRVVSGAETPVNDGAGPPEAPKVEAGRRPAAAAKDPLDAFARITRVVRLTIALEQKVDDALRGIISGNLAERDARHAKAAERATADAADRAEAAEARERRVHDLVEAAIAAEAPDIETYDARYAAMMERLDEDEAYEGCGDMPLEETVRRLCADLCLSPDWSRWTGEGWVSEHPPARTRFSPFHEPRPTPVYGEAPAEPSPPGRRLE